ncbi:competence protein ComEA [Gracilibacillus orientalis]|uniref:Competence protein ComEA n=1 Tax=Gracilibacillus orientalis TaxID=334253 RepID=A0A1I4KQ23_9BACI|nr:helix-hairpin-helix domain-containing protein [Gracilibacillus orientalis]SFL80868.1 competence protein ComEA [Gracilibacillus orientalis]
MSWILKNWYLVLVIAAILLWLLIDPSIEEQNDAADQMMENNPELLEEEKTVPTEYKIDIKGEIENPGVYQVTENDRVEDAIQLAGGFNSKADKQMINLAERVYDEMVIHVPAKGENAEGTHQMKDMGSDDQKVKVNLASIEEMQTIPGIGEVKANAIMEYRETYGRFEKIEDLTKVSGIGEKTVEKLKEYVRIP